ncbi:proline--tRNA ligase [Paenibacillus eucommiae]|uniref:Proline--tRNA ligase n=1 Tax=Paenibacillus eucommiae TaxID=1355755 RepID=A0ABS4J5G4_9BACL|nr:proline--tRNA ligase [Paenibacillus eucommiae]MBP1995077.1 prolyl-tRNA synthetase [Paenibacillus eucommiae]
MRQNTLLSTTLREAPADAEVISHQWMLRAGFIRQLAAGIYTYLPLGWRVLRKVEQIVREEMDRAGAQEMLMPAMQPTELWKESGRYAVYGPELIRLHDRHEREFALGPTHEEVITKLVSGEISSYRRLPVTLYQIQTKFRDERRPRFGLLRGREFLMKDAYSFDADWAGLDQTYWKMYDAYQRIFNRCALKYRPVEADAGAIGGEGGTHEFMALADIGEDTIAVCPHCEYAANIEKAVAGAVAGTGTGIGIGTGTVPQTPGSLTVEQEDLAQEQEKIHTPGIRTIDQLVQALGVEANEIIKTLIYTADGQAIAVLVRGDHEVNEIKVKNVLSVENLEIANAEVVAKATGAPVGFVGPVGLTIPVFMDRGVADMSRGIAGANEQDYHIRNVQPKRDLSLEHIGDFRNVVEGDICPRCEEGSLQFYRGIEVGHVFKLGTKYSEKLGARFLDASGSEQVMIMGCYGIGVSRILSAIVEQNQDEQGIIWPMALAPFQVHVIPVSLKDEIQMKTAEELYQRLVDCGIEVLLDDRDERPGVKFKDSDLIGIPIRIVVGKHAAEGNVEFKERARAEQKIMKLEDAFSCVVELVKASRVQKSL